MKENNLNRVIGWSGLLLTSLLSTSALADNIGTSAEELGLSDYRHFVIYPRLDKALKAQKNNDEATAIREFEYIHQQVPDNIPLTLYLAEAYRHFGHDDRARLLLEDQLKRHPGDARLERSLAAIPVEVKSITTVEELLAQQKACDAAPTLRCRSEVGQNALRLAQLPVARAQLNDATFAASPEGKTLRTDLLQRAIYLKQWSQADTLYNEARQQNTLSAAERRQWFDVLLAGQLDDRILALQSQGIFTDPQSYITYATALAYRGEKARLQHYLIENKPLFTTDAQEKSWLYLLSKYSANPVQALANYTVQFADNRQYVVGATLPVLLKEGQYDAAQKLLATLPANEMLEERYAVSVATRNKAEALRLARLLYQQESANLTRLDQLTWQLMQNEQSREAADLLLQRYPFQGDARISQTLMARLASLLESHPYLATPAKVAILSKPLPLAEQRQWQSQLPGIADNCPAIVRLLGDMSPSYDAAAWNRLAKCYRDTLPGVALYAWLQAEQRQPNAWQHRAVAYQAYQVEDYATALAARQKISLHDMSNEDLLAAANTAQAAGNGAARDRWLQQAEQRGLGSNALYWWLHAQRYIPGQPELALNDLTRSINIAPSANAYVARATIYRQRHNVPAAVSDLRAALELEPNNSNTQAALGYALWDSGDIAQSREMLEQAHKGLPDDPALIRQLAYVNQRLDDMPATQHYARLVIDDIDNQALITPLTPEQNQQRFNFRRLHEEVGRRWTFSFDSSIGLRSGAMSTANNNVGGAAPGKSYRSYGQLEADPEFFMHQKQSSAALESYLNRLLAADLQQARLWSAVPGVTPDGWYFSAEIDDLNWRSEAARQPLLTWLNNAQRLISDVSAKPVYISSFFAGNMSPDGYRQLLEHVKATGVNVWVQDGSGVDKLTAEQRERYLQASADCQSSAPASGIVYELFVAGKGKTFTAKPKPDAEIASLLAKRSSCGKDTLYFSLRYLPVAHGILEY